ncbi:MAG TPA: hypothetical protein VH395_01290 [Jatrophihabitantaceae bacterium]|jgi:hypothetical protein
MSQADLQRIEAEQRLHCEQQRKAALVAAASAHDADDARMLFGMLGLDRDVLVAARKSRAASARTARRRRHAA